MSQYYGAEHVQCPFYEDETKNTLKCEGEFSQSCTFVFLSSTKKNNHKFKYCNQKYNLCPHFKRVREKYP